MGESAALELDSVSFGFPDSDFVIDNVSFSVEQRGYLTIIGPSGSGKTTLLKLIGGFLKVRSGHILATGCDITEFSPGSRGIVTVFQDPTLFPHLNVWENIAFGLMARGARKAEARMIAEKALDDVKLSTEFSERSPTKLSGGEKHRVAIARALVMKPNLLLLDEPLAAIDDPLRGSIENLLDELRRNSDVTFVEVTHIQEHALAVSSRIALLEKGKIREVSTPRDIYYRPRTAFAATFLGGANVLEGTIKSLPDMRGLSFRCNTGGFVANFTYQSVDKTIHNNQPASLILRPESISLIRSQAHDNDCEGKVAHRLFRGCHIEYVFFVGGTQLNVRSIDSEMEPLQEGQVARMYWSSADALLIPLKHIPEGNLQ